MFVVDELIVREILRTSWWDVSVRRNCRLGGVKLHVCNRGFLDGEIDGAPMRGGRDWTPGRDDAIARAIRYEDVIR
jgi:hypothetical protein